MTNAAVPVDPFSSFRLDGKVALVTGASGGLGERFARVLHAAGATVVVSARRLDRLEALASELDGAIPIACDMGDEAAVGRLAAEALEATGTVDVLVNNAGVGGTYGAEDEPLESFRWVVDVNLVGLFQLSQLVGRHMLGAGTGNIVNVASILGFVAAGQIPQASYTASKAAVINLTREMAVQWARRGIRVNALCPGWFPTDMTDELFSDEGGARYLRRNTPMGRGGEAHELDGALLYLSSDASSYMTGQTLVVDGGWLAR